METVLTKDLPHDALPLRTVSRMTGLSADVIRAWERRYGVVAPLRGPRGARLYSAADVTQLRLLRQAVATGRAIGDIAGMSRGALEQLVGASVATPVSLPAGAVVAAAAGRPEGERLTQALAALERFDRAALDRCLGDALIALGSRGFVAQVAVPLLVEVGERWRDGRLSVADEHLLSGLMHNLLAGVLRARGGGGEPTVLLATPRGERHEFGLLMAGLIITEADCGLCYLGTDLPAAEIGAAARRAGAAVVGLGVSCVDDLDAVVAEVRRVERDLPATTELWIGGREAGAVVAQMGATRAVVVDQLSALDHEVNRLRAQRAGRA